MSGRDKIPDPSLIDVTKIPRVGPEVKWQLVPSPDDDEEWEGGKGGKGKLEDKNKD